MQGIVDNITGLGIYDMDPPVLDDATYKYYLNMFKYNFDTSYLSNRVPFGIYTHYFWYYLTSGAPDTRKIDFVKECISYILSKPNVLFATERDVIDWVKNP